MAPVTDMVTFTQNDQAILQDLGRSYFNKVNVIAIRMAGDFALRPPRR
jgi:hypothetical protein